MPRKACAVCGAPALPRSTRCERHPRKARELRPDRNTARGRRVRQEVLDAAARDEVGRVLCHLCHEAIEDDADGVLDHLIPHADGGPFEPDNLAPAHPDCNRRRGRRPLRP